MSRTVELVTDLFRLFDEGGIDAVLAATPEDVVWAPLGAEGREFVGPEVREYFVRQRQAGAEQTQRALDLEAHGDAVVVRGSVQIHSRDTHVDFQPTWTYEFEGERLRRATGHPTYRDALRHLGELPGESP
jgi:ketosteroid isomerase-like protein